MTWYKETASTCQRKREKEGREVRRRKRGVGMAPKIAANLS